jgi:hypothetical protein
MSRTICAIISTIVLLGCGAGHDAAGQQQEQQERAGAVAPEPAAADTFLAFTIQGDGYTRHRMVASTPREVSTYLMPMPQHGMTAISAHGDGREGSLSLDAKPGLRAAGRYEFGRHPDEELVDNVWITIRPAGGSPPVHYYLVDGAVTIVEYGGPDAPATGTFSGRYVKAMRRGGIDLIADPAAPREYVSISDGFFRVPYRAR